jgi:NitT/TauT family transport system permease protein
MTRPSRYRLLIMVAFFLALEAACRTGVVDQHALIAPSQMVVGAYRALSNGAIRHDIFLTLGTVCSSVILAFAAGSLVGVLLHWMPQVRKALDPFLASYYAVPTFVFYPVFIVMFGLNRWPLIAIGFIFSIVAVVISMLDGLSRVPRSLVRTAQAMRLSKMQTIFHVMLPSAAPWLVTGFKLAIAYSFIGVIAGEFVLSNDGLGHAIAFAYNSFDNSTMYGLILLLFTIVGGINLAIWIQERKIYARRGAR